MLFTELPLLERPAAAKAAGFDAVEFWWPFAVAVPSDAEVDEFVGAVEGAGVQLIGLNFFAGDMPGGDRGLVSWPARSGEFRDNVDVVVGIGDRLGCKAFNALYGNRTEESTPVAQDDVATKNLALAAQAVARIGGVVLVEPVSGAPRYPLLTAADVIRVIDRVEVAAGVTNVKFLCDLYHLDANGDNVTAAIEDYADRVGHVQIADSPGRGEPGTGKLDINGHLAALAAKGYNGYVALEYKPTVATLDSLAWLPPADRSSSA
jgi:hydroxypyruvate isomerase